MAYSSTDHRSSLERLYSKTLTQGYTKRNDHATMVKLESAKCILGFELVRPNYLMPRYSQVLYYELTSQMEVVPEA